jgi:hypothetical protein
MHDISHESNIAEQLENLPLNPQKPLISGAFIGIVGT